MTKAEELLKALTDEAPVNWWQNGPECAYCKADMPWGKDLEDPDSHTPECPWRLAKEYLHEKGAQMIPKSEWVWYGFPGHFICGRRCVYHLCTRIGNRLVSTVGAFYPNGPAKPMETIGSGDKSFYETTVFRCDGETDDGDPNITDWDKLSCERYETSIEAECGHRKICRDIAGEGVT